jgi:hypothetical protein
MIRERLVMSGNSLTEITTSFAAPAADLRHVPGKCEPARSHAKSAFKGRHSPAICGNSDVSGDLRSVTELLRQYRVLQLQEVDSWDVLDLSATHLFLHKLCKWCRYRCIRVPYKARNTYLCSLPPRELYFAAWLPLPVCLRRFL